jgi:hypothetical protein
MSFADYHAWRGDEQSSQLQDEWRHRYKSLCLQDNANGSCVPLHHIKGLTPFCRVQSNPLFTVILGVNSSNVPYCPDFLVHDRCTCRHSR